MNIEIRRAKPSDKRAVLDIVRTVWGGEDYIPEVFDAWVRDRRGPLYAAVVSGRVVGIGKITRLTTDETWTEGARVAPRYRGRGIGRALLAHRVKQARRLGVRVTRFSTSERNTPMHRIARHLGFRKAATVDRWDADAAAGEPLRRARAADVPRAWRLLRGELIKDASGWRWRMFTREDVVRATRAGRCLLTQDRRAVAILAPARDREGLLVVATGADAASAHSLFVGLRAEAARRRLENVSAYVPRGRFARALRAAGYTRPYDESPVVYEKVL